MTFSHLARRCRPLLVHLPLVTAAFIACVAVAPAQGTCIFPTPDGATIERVYTPPEVTAPHAMHRATVFYPPTGTRPANGWPVILSSGAGNFLEPLNGAGGTGPRLQICSASAADLYSLCMAGFCVVSIGTVGINSTGLGPDPNVFYPYGSPEWNRFDLYWGEKDIVWARQWLAENEASLQIDNGQVITMGVSAGASYASSIALGPRRKFLGAVSTHAEQDTRCAGVVALMLPSWIRAFTDSFFGNHWINPTTGSHAITIAEADPDDLARSSASRWIRDPASYAFDTPAFLAYEDPLASNEFRRDAVTGDPILTGAIDWVTALHATWFGLNAMQDLLSIHADFHTGQSLLIVEDDVDLSSLGSPASGWTDLRFDGTVGTQMGEFQGLLFAWLQRFLVPSDATATTRNGSGINPVVFTTNEVPVLGTTWNAHIDASAYPLAVSVLALSHAQPSSGIVIAGGELLIDIFSASSPFVFAISGPSSTGAVELAVPADPSLLGLKAPTQGIVLGGGYVLTNALDLVLGY
ncbi:MAG: hypothetical protein AAF628_19305 [Planctomycetota bacterium]